MPTEGKINLPTAVQFYDAFLKRYEQERKSHNDNEWEKVWTDTNLWSNLMIYRKNAVLREVAQSLYLQCYDREPLRLDAVFTTPDPKSQQLWDWFPIIVAIEHENNPWGFHGEINKLFSICCALKVGITYALLDQRKKPDEIKRIILDRIKRSYESRGSLINEDPKTEYLFLIGHECKPRMIEWSALMFNAGQGTKTASFLS